MAQLVIFLLVRLGSFCTCGIFKSKRNSSDIFESLSSSLLPSSSFPCDLYGIPAQAKAWSNSPSLEIGSKDVFDLKSYKRDTLVCNFVISTLDCDVFDCWELLPQLVHYSTLNCEVFVCWELLRQLVHYLTQNCVVFLCWKHLRQRPHHCLYFLVSTLDCDVFICRELLRQLVHYSTQNCVMLVVFVCWELLRQRPRHRRSDQRLSCADSRTMVSFSSS